MKSYRFRAKTATGRIVAATGTTIPTFQLGKWLAIKAHPQDLHRLGGQGGLGPMERMADAAKQAGYHGVVFLPTNAEVLDVYEAPPSPTSCTCDQLAEQLAALSRAVVAMLEGGVLTPDVARALMLEVQKADTLATSMAARATR
jgi:hypothetical protein